MLKKFLRGFSRVRPVEPPPVRRSLPPPDVPVVALTRAQGRPAASIARDDYALTEETNNDIASDLEEAFALIRARQHINEAQRRIADGEFLVTMGVVEKFAYECLDFGPERTHNIPVVQLGKAFENWLQVTGRYEVRRAAFARAMTSVLEWQGGHRSSIDGNDLFVGCRLTESFTESLRNPSRRFAPSSPSKDRLGMGIAELLGERRHNG